MALKVILTLCAIVSAVTAQYGGYGEHVTYKEEPYDPHPEYKFEYSVHDAHTGDIKSQQEQRHGDSVQGYYKLVEADGSERFVEYKADHKNGFNAVVHRQHNRHPAGHYAPAQHAPAGKYYSQPSHSYSSYSSRY